MTNQTTPRTVILGAGFGGLRTALELERQCGRSGACEILLIDKETEHHYSALLYEVATGGLEMPPAQCVGELHAGVCVNFEQYTTIVGARHIRFRRGTVTNVDHARRIIRFEDGSTQSYDDVVLAFGAEVATYGISGLDTHALPMKTLRDAMRVRVHLYRLLGEYKKGERDHLSIVVGGAGATGCEFSAELGNFFERIARAGVFKPADLRLTLVEAGPNILGMMRSRLQVFARKRLERLGVKILTDTAIESVESHTVRLKSGETLEADLMVWTGGIKPAAVISNLDFPKDKKGRLLVDETLRVQGQERVYALGDAAAFVVDPATGQSVPALAQVAIAEAGIVAKNIVRAQEGKSLLGYRPPKHWPTILPLGGKYAIADFGRLTLTGWPAYVLRRFVDLYYFASILPLHYAWHMWLRGAKMYIQND